MIMDLILAEYKQQEKKMHEKESIVRFFCKNEQLKRNFKKAIHPMFMDLKKAYDNLPIHKLLKLISQLKTKTEGTVMNVLTGVVRAKQMTKHYETVLKNIEKEQLVWYDLCSKNGR